MKYSVFKYNNLKNILVRGHARVCVGLCGLKKKIYTYLRLKSQSLNCFRTCKPKKKKKNKMPKYSMKF